MLKTHVIIVVSGDIRRDRNQRIILRENTKGACDEAVRTFFTKQHKGERGIIVLIAGPTGKKWERVIVSALMKEYIKHTNPSLPKRIKLKSYESEGSSLYSAVKTAVKRFSKHNNDKVLSIIICVQYWRFYRLRMITDILFRECGGLKDRIQFSRHVSTEISFGGSALEIAKAITTSPWWILMRIWIYLKNTLKWSFNLSRIQDSGNHTRWA